MDETSGAAVRSRRGEPRRDATIMPLKPCPVRVADDDGGCEPFFIVTAGRSGSTLLRAIINRDPSLCIPPESHVLGPVSRKFKRCFRFLPWEYVVRAVGSEFESRVPGFGFWKLDMHPYYARALALAPEQRSLAKLIDLVYVQYLEQKKPGASRWGDKTIGNAMFLPSIDQLFPTARYILLIRDGRDAAVSLVAADTTPVTDLGRAADYWVRSVTLSRAFVAGLHPARHLEVRYEDLVREPERVVERVYDFLGVPFRAEVLDVSETIAQLGDADREIHRGLRRPINTDSIGKWRRALDRTQQEALQRQIAAKLHELGYATD
jgi:hypothetical protein